MKSVVFPFVLMLQVVLFYNTSSAQDQFYQDFNREYLRSGSLHMGFRYNKFNPRFDVLNYDIFEETGAYNFTDQLIADSTTFNPLMYQLGIGFPINDIQVLLSGGFAGGNPLNNFNFGLGLGFNYVVHFSYKSGLPTVWLDGFLNYSYINSRIRLKTYDINQPPMAFFDGEQFPDIGTVVGGTYKLNIESHNHVVEPVAGINVAINKKMNLRFSAAYSLLLNQGDPRFLLRFEPNEDENSLASKERKTFANNVEQINLDNKRMEGFPLEMSRWNFSVSVVFRFGVEEERDPDAPLIFN